MNKQLFTFFAALSFLSTAVPLSSQVAIGRVADGIRKFSLLELNGYKYNSAGTVIGNYGLRLPQMSSGQRDVMEGTFGSLAENGAKGLMIFNTTINCVQTWNGNTWISACDGSGSGPSSSPSSPAPGLPVTPSGATVPTGGKSSPSPSSSQLSASEDETSVTLIKAGSEVFLSQIGTGGTWVSSEPSVAEVIPCGAVTGIKPGKARITYLYEDRVEEEYYVEVVLFIEPELTAASDSINIINSYNK
jgi:hypothetical protein